MIELRRRLAGVPPRTRIVTALAALAAAAAIAAAAWSVRDTRVALFAAPLRPEQLAEVETRLAAWRVPFAPVADNVRVDPHGRADLLLRLALAGIPHAHLAGTAEAFARAGALAPQAILEAQTRDALGADLAEGLRGLEGVADARVIVAPGRSGVYADDPERVATASVRVTLVPGARLATATVAGIRAFVAGGVPGLAPERVTVLDDSGTLDGVSGERDAPAIERSLQTALDTAFGPGTTIVRVHREPLGEARESRAVRETALPGTVALESAGEHYEGEKKRYGKSAQTERHARELREVRSAEAPDATARVSVAIFVDGARTLDLEKIRALAEAAAGLERSRGDTLAVEAVRFAPAAVAPPRGVDGWALAGLFAGTLPQLALVAAGVALALAAGRPVYRLALRACDRTAARRAAAAAPGLPPGRLHGVLAGEPPYVAAAVISALPAATATAVLELYPA